MKTLMKLVEKIREQHQVVLDKYNGRLEGFGKETRAVRELNADETRGWEAALHWCAELIGHTIAEKNLEAAKVELRPGQLSTNDVAEDYPGPCPIDHFCYCYQHINGDVFDITLDCIGGRYVVSDPFNLYEHDNLPDALRKMADMIDGKL